MPKSRKAPRPNRNTISYQLRRAIEARSDLTTYALGKAAGVSPAVISRFLSQERGLTLETADRLALALGLRLVSAGRRGSKLAGETSTDTEE